MTMITYQKGGLRPQKRRPEAAPITIIITTIIV
jgi:hypothetical protein